MDPPKPRTVLGGVAESPPLERASRHGAAATLAQRSPVVWTSRESIWIRSEASLVGQIQARPGIASTHAESAAELTDDE